MNLDALQQAEVHVNKVKSCTSFYFYISSGVVWLWQNVKQSLSVKSAGMNPLSGWGNVLDVDSGIR